MDDAQVWKIIDTYFKDTPHALVKHHIDSYNYFYRNDIYKILQDTYPMKVVSKENLNGEFESECKIYVGGKNGDKVYFGKPVVYDGEGKEHFMFPNEARLRNMTYAMTIHYDVDVEVTSILHDNDEPSLEGNEFLKGINDGNIDILDDSNDDNFVGGATKKPAQPKARVVNNMRQIKTTQIIADRISEEARNSLNDKHGIRTQTNTFTLDKIFLGKFPIMVQSEFCVLHGMTQENMCSMGECRNDKGGYFIIDGKEKAIVSQEKFADNVLYVKKLIDNEESDTTEDINDNDNDNDNNNDNEVILPEFLYSAQIVSVPENSSMFARTFSIKMVGPTKLLSNMNIVVNIPNVKLPVPLFIVFRALGILSDKDIITMCLLDIDKYESLIDLFIPSVHDSGGFYTQEDCLNFIGLLTKGMTISHAHEILIDYLLPHIGKHDYLQKAYYLGHMVFKLLSVKVGIEMPTDRDNFKYKRVELVGPLLNNLFTEYYKIQKKNVQLSFEQILYYNKGQYESNLAGLIRLNYAEIFKSNKDLETGVKKAFKGNWGAQSHTKRIGVVQDLDRLSFNSMMSHLRKIVLPMDPTTKIVEPRKLHCSQWGFIDPIDTPDGSKIGFHKNLAISTQITRGYPSSIIMQWIRKHVKINLLADCKPYTLSTMTKLFVNGRWIGGIETPIECIEKLLLFRRNGLIPLYTSATFNITDNSIFIYTDGGRLCRPIFYVKNNELFGEDSNTILDKLRGDVTWNQLITGFNPKADPLFDPNQCKVYELKDLYDKVESNNPAQYEKFLKNKAIIEYIDCSETENALISINSKKLKKSNTHCEIHESLILGMMGNQITFPETNPMARNLFSCGQSKQACSLYHTNYQMRMDKTSMVLNYGQIPLLKSRFGKYINNNENSYGENAIVAIMCYTGYNVEDAILINEGALNRGLFRTSYFTTYETYEENTMNAANIWIDKKIGNVDDLKVVQGKKVGHIYHKLDSNGMIREGEIVNDKTILIGLTTNSAVNSETRIDQSIFPKKGQLGTVDKSYITEGEEGERIGKVRIVDQRIPTLGDKFASRVGQKGTIGMVIREVDMPFTNKGIRPDIIINPHAIPSRMTIGQLVESITGKACALYGGFGDCTAFNQKGSKVEEFGELLVDAGFHSKGNEILYDGMTGKQIESDIFIGPTYYMRLKHMVKDKINYRNRGPNTQLTRQSVGGRANDGGLRIGEMEKDSIVSYGATNFLTESMMERGDKYHFAVCNKSGMTAIYNPAKNLFMSPIMDGPIKFSGLSDLDTINVERVSQFGRDFSVISVPYTLKLLIQELGCMNIQLRIITEDNIEQLDNLSSSFNSDALKTNINRIVKKNIIPQDEHIDVSNASWDVVENENISLIDNVPIVDVVPLIDDESIYGWKKLISKKHNTHYWFNVQSNKAEWTEPYKLIRRNQILAFDNKNAKYSVGDSVYYLKDTSVNSDPDTVWNIDEVSNGSDTQINISDVSDPSSTKIVYPIDVEFLRKIVIPSSPTFIIPSSYRNESSSVQKGGNHKNFLYDEIVHLNDDVKSKRTWYITNVDNDHITITTDDVDGLTSSDVIRVVNENDISRPEQQNPLSIPGGIIFAPVIKVINGNELQPNLDVDTKIRQPNLDIDKRHFIEENMKPTDSRISFGGEGDEKSSQGVIGSIIDFTKNIIVKKLQ